MNPLMVVNPYAPQYGQDKPWTCGQTDDAALWSGGHPPAKPKMSKP